MPQRVGIVATERKGIEDLSAAITSYFDFQKAETGGMVRKTAIARWRLTELVQERLLSDLMSQNGTSEKLDSLAAQIAGKEIDPYSAVEKILNRS